LKIQREEADTAEPTLMARDKDAEKNLKDLLARLSRKINKTLVTYNQDFVEA